MIKEIVVCWRGKEVQELRKGKMVRKLGSDGKLHQFAVVSKKRK